MFTKYLWVGGALGMAVYSVTYFLKTKLKVEKVIKYFPLKKNVAYLSWYFTRRFKTKQSLRSDVDRSIDRQTR